MSHDYSGLSPAASSRFLASAQTGGWQRALLRNRQIFVMAGRSKEAGYIHLEAREWTETQRQHGVLVKLKKASFKVRLFKVVALDGSIDWMSPISLTRHWP